MFEELVAGVVQLAEGADLSAIHLAVVADFLVGESFGLAVSGGGDLIAECRIIHRGKRTLVGEFEVTDPTGRLIARGIGTNLLLEQSEI